MDYFAAQCFVAEAVAPSPAGSDCFGVAAPLVADLDYFAEQCFAVAAGAAARRPAGWHCFVKADLRVSLGRCPGAALAHSGHRVGSAVAAQPRLDEWWPSENCQRGAPQVAPAELLLQRARQPLVVFAARVEVSFPG